MGEASFERFWQAYPKHDDIEDAQVQWREQKLDALIDTILTAIERQKPKWARAGYRYVYKPSKWLKNQCWLDVAIAAFPASKDLDHDDSSPVIAEGCHERGCEASTGTISARYCDLHAAAIIADEADSIANIFSIHKVDEGNFSNLEQALQQVLERNHDAEVARRILLRLFDTPQTTVMAFIDTITAVMLAERQLSRRLELVI